MSIVDLLRKNAREIGEQCALVELDVDVRTQWVPEEPSGWRHNLAAWCVRRELSWSEFNQLSNQWAGFLMTRGISTGDRVGILMLNGIEWLPVYFGVLKAGAVVVPLNFRYESAEIDYCLELAEVKALVFGSEFTARLAETQSAREGRCAMLMVGGPCPEFAEPFVGDPSAVDPCILTDPSDDAAIYFSSGTTGFPKAILHCHSALIHAARAEQNHHSQTGDDVFLCIPPLYHAGAKMHWFGSLLTGGRCVLLRGVTPWSILAAVSAEKCTIVWLLVPWAQDILLAIERGELDPAAHELDQWRLMHIGAQPVPENLIWRWQETFPNQRYDTNYGLTEATGPGCVHLGVDNVDHAGAIGRAGYGWRTKVVDDCGRDVVRGQRGELAVRGPGVMKGYFKDETATRAVLDSDGWLLTGDIVEEDPDGFLWLVDRKKDVIISGGENIYPGQIERFLAGDPRVKDVALIGLPDERLGEVAAAVVEVKPDVVLTSTDVFALCEELPRYKRPRHIIFAPVIRNGTGKIDKPALRAMYAHSDGF
ncbi:MAG: long-chain fatty acid--CoA ligase [Propionibacteriaceae bacterium]|uniref:AMP-binding enzyme n=1 Tax=Propionibacterium ruminifibrarum TaxID=1962131 RepID=A0A375I588_9ACTN|nr:class I adenylate-forming enzyme family protein [Propionibacterium ruminifibrarum]MBE6477219.1 long-chain fatty acid--CoA ligase [Propionibacteriaceae bacterium]SPF68552.1 AMP-binding enzyme [Propionibacterium ruminifibrarum]